MLNAESSYRRLNHVQITVRPAPQITISRTTPAEIESKSERECTMDPTVATEITRPAAAAVNRPPTLPRGRLCGVDRSDDPHTLQYSAVTAFGCSLRQYFTSKLEPQ